MPLRGAAPAFALAAGLLAACAPQPALLPAAPVAAGDAISVSAEPLPLNPQDPAQDRIGDFVFAGALRLTSRDTARLHGLSDLLVSTDGRLTAVSDDGDLFQAELALDSAGRLTGLTDTRLAPLADLDGKPLQGKEAADAEGMAALPGGDLLISFERRHRIWRYPASGGPPRPAPTPQADLPLNEGLEALTVDPALGPDAYTAAAESSGETWTCRLSAVCEPGPRLDLPDDFSIVAMRRLPTGETAYLFRAFDPLRGVRSILRIAGPGGEVAQLRLARPYTIDNFEGLDAVPLAGGGFRFYLVSDDNFSSSQRTLLLALDWKPKPGQDQGRRRPN